MAKAKSKRKILTKAPVVEQDSVYFLKLVLYLMLGSAWLKFTDGVESQFPIPVGMLIGLLFIQHEHFRIDRKIEYAVLLVSSFIGFWLPIGIFVNV